MKNKDPILNIENLSVKFKKGTENAVSDFNLKLHESEKLALIGESGSGKSVLILSILCLLENAETEGCIYYGGKNLLDLKREELDKIRGNEIGYVPQGSGNGLNPLIKVGYQIGETLIVHKNYDIKQALGRSIELLKKFNIGFEEKRVYQYPHTFSGGMKQRAMIAMGIAAGAKIILADEPTKGLDTKRIELVKESFRLLNDEAMIIVTHDLNFAKNVSTRLGVIYSSYLIEEGDTEEIFKNPFHPYTKSMVDALPENGLKVKKGFIEKPSANNGCKYRLNCDDCFEKCINTPPVMEVENRKVRCWKYA